MRVLPAGGLAAASVLLASTAVVAGTSPADVCLEVAPGAVTADEWDAVTAAVEMAVAERSALFPVPSLEHSSSRLDISSGHDGSAQSAAPCLEPGSEWSARFGREFLEAGADQMLAEASTTPGIDSAVSIEWYPDETRLRTVLVFAGPLDFPNGTCWIDDELSVADGMVEASGDQGLETSPFAEGACGRFFDQLPDGGAGEQAVTLLPAEVAMPDGRRLRFVVEDVVVHEDAISVAGRLARN